MTSEPTGGEGSRWLLEPPVAGEVQLHIAIGEGTELSPQLQAALDRLVAALYQDEVTGYASTCYPQCPKLTACSDYTCLDLNNCSVLVRQPCLVDQRCKITLA
jgi:hypothetical protein